MNKTTEALKMAYKAEETGNVQDLVDAVNALLEIVEALESQEQEYDINEMIDKITPENLWNRRE